MKRKPAYPLVILIAILIESATALIWTLIIPGERKSALIFGLSPQRLLLAAVPFFVFVLAGAIVVIVYIHPADRQKEAGWLKKMQAWQKLVPLFFWLSVTSLTVLLLGEVVLEFSAAIVERLTPLMLLLFLVFTQAGILLQRTSAQDKRPDWKFPLKAFLWCFGAVGLLVLAGCAVGLQHALASPYASNTGIPILPKQIVIALYATATFVCLEKMLKHQSAAAIKVNFIMAVVLFITAAGLWMSVPISENHFTHASNMGNGEFALHSDALTYDINAQKMLLGYGLAGGQPLPRPLYSFFLGIIHYVFGAGVRAAIDVQTVVLALMPVCIFLLGCRFFTPAAGVLAALLFIFREYNQAALSGVYTLSSVRMLMSELFTAMFITALTIVAMHWLNHPSSRTRAVMAGAFLGITALVRSQVLVFFPLLALWGLFALWQQRKRWLRAMLWLSIGLLLVILPWMGRNAIRSASLVFEDPGYSSRTLVVHSEEGETAGVLSSAFADPLEYLLQTTSYLANNATSSLNQFPWPGSLDDDLDDYIQVKPEPPFYPDSKPQAGQTWIILVHLGLIILGLTGAWQAAGWGGLLPFGFYLGYALSSSLARYSGWRFILPVDWVVLLYWALGVFAVLQMLARWIGQHNEGEPLGVKRKPGREWPAGWLLTAACLLGLVVPIGETCFHKKIEILDRPAILQKISHSDAPQALQMLAQGPSARLAQGLLLYPIYLEDNRAFNRLAITNPLILSKKPLLRFVVLGDGSPTVYLPMKDAPQSVPLAGPVIAVGCVHENTFFASGVLIGRDNPYWALSNRKIPMRCE